MTRTATTFDTMPQSIDLILKRMDELEAKFNAQQTVGESAATHIFLKEAAELVGKSPSTIYKLAGAGKIPAYKNGKQWIFVKEELQAWMTRMPSHKVSYKPNEKGDATSLVAAIAEQVRPRRGRKPSAPIF
ncbi:MAG: helix-turn-helix domain-containing protein [Rikenellaceae bacterium]